MERIVARLNIEHFHKRLDEKTDDTKRQTLLRLLAEEEAKLAALMNSPKERESTALGRSLLPVPPVCGVRVNQLLGLRVNPFAKDAMAWERENI